MSVQENVQLMRRWFKEVWNEEKIQTVHDLFAPDGIGIGQQEEGKPLHGPADFVPFVERIRGAFPDIQIVVEDAVGAGDKVVLRWTATMSHRGDPGDSRQQQECAGNWHKHRSDSGQTDYRGMG